MTNSSIYAGAALVAALAMPSAHATLVATISGQYGSPVGDDPNLFIHNTTGLNFTNVTLTGVAYQGSNAALPAGVDVDLSPPTATGTTFHKTQVKNLADIIAGTTLTYTFHDAGAGVFCGGLPKGDLFSQDYDDSYGCSGAAQPGNVRYTFVAMWNGGPIFAQFSPTTNATGVFIGFLGLDQNGFAETSFDNGGAASGVGQFGVLANIFTGTVPEPGTLALFGLAGAAIIGSIRRKAATRG